MRRILALGTLALGVLVAPPARAMAPTSLTIAPGGGLGALAVTVDVAGMQVRYASCKEVPCAITTTSPALPISAGDVPLDPKGVTVEDIALGAGRHLVHVKALLGADSGPETPAWEALLAPGAPSLFAGRTGWSRGEPGERSGTDVRFLVEGEHRIVVVGDIREDLRICGDDATLLDPRGLDPRTLVFHGATLQRLSAARRDSAIAIEATPRHSAPEPALAHLLAATDASSAVGPVAALTDGDVATAWSEGRPGRGQGEFVLLQTPFDVPIVRFEVTVAPSRPKPEGAAPETFYLATGAGTYEVTLPEDGALHPGEAYEIPLPQPIQTSCVALVLADAFTHGKAHPEVSIAELTAFSPFDHVGATLAEVASALGAGDARAAAAAALLERAGAAGFSAMTTAYPTLDPAGRALAINVAASASSCASSARLLSAGLTDGDDVVRGKAAAKLQEPACGREALPSLVAALENPTARAKVAPLVAFFGREGALGPLVAVLGEGTSEDRHAVRSAVAFAGRGAAPAELSTLLVSTSARSPEASLDLLRALGDRLGEVPAAADASMAPLLAGAAPLATRYLLVDGVARVAGSGDEVARARLADLILADPSAEVRARATELLANVRDPVAVAAKTLADPSPRVRQAALGSVQATAQVRAQASLAPVVIELLGHDPWTFVRLSAADALGAMPANPVADRALGDALDQLSPRVREQSTLALAARGAKGYRDAIRGHLTDAKEDPAVRAASAHALGVLCDAEASDILARMAVSGGASPDPGDVSLGLVATAALGLIHPRDLTARFAPLRGKGVRPDARAAADRALADVGHCPLP